MTPHKIRAQKRLLRVLLASTLLVSPYGVWAGSKSGDNDMNQNTEKVGQHSTNANTVQTPHQSGQRATEGQSNAQTIHIGFQTPEKNKEENLADHLGPDSIQRYFLRSPENRGGNRNTDSSNGGAEQVKRLFEK